MSIFLMYIKKLILNLKKLFPQIIWIILSNLFIKNIHFYFFIFITLMITILTFLMLPFYPYDTIYCSTILILLSIFFFLFFLFYFLSIWFIKFLNLSKKIFFFKILFMILILYFLFQNMTLIFFKWNDEWIHFNISILMISLLVNSSIIYYIYQLEQNKIYFFNI